MPCEDAPCCGCCPSNEVWTPDPSDYQEWVEWVEEIGAEIQSHREAYPEHDQFLFEE